MSIYDINYYDKAVELMPPDKRNATGVSWVRTLVSQLQYSANRVLLYYRVGLMGNVWNPSATYWKGALVRYKGVVYESLSAGNIGERPPNGFWRQYLPSFIGVDTRVLYNGHHIVLEAALNKFFATNFRQPKLLGWAAVADADHAKYSDIYILNSSASVVGFLVGSTVGSTVAFDDIDYVGQWTIPPSGGYSIGDVFSYLGRMYLSKVNANYDVPPSAKWHQTDTIGYLSTFVFLSNFTVYVPSAVYTSSLPFAPTIESEMRQFIDKIIPIGLVYKIIPY